MTQREHERLGLGLRRGRPQVKVLLVNGFLDGQIDAEGTARKERVEALAIVDVCLAVQKHPVVVTQHFFGGCDKAWLRVHRTVENLARVLGRRGNHDKDVEHASSTERATVPCLLVLFERRVQRVGELADQRDRPGWARQAALLDAIHDLLHRQQTHCEGQHSEYDLHAGNVMQTLRHNRGDVIRDRGVQRSYAVPYLLGRIRGHGVGTREHSTRANVLFITYAEAGQDESIDRPTRPIT